MTTQELIESVNQDLELYDLELQFNDRLLCEARHVYDTFLESQPMKTPCSIEARWIRFATHPTQKPKLLVCDSFRQDWLATLPHHGESMVEL